MSLNLDSFPYYDDFSAAKGFHKILFVPGNPVQARELNQIQSIIQEQIKKMGNHFFQNGTVIIPGHTFYDNTVKYVKVETTYESTNVETYLSNVVGSIIEGASSGVSALVVHAEKSTENDPVTLFIKYVGANGSTETFTAGEKISDGSYNFTVATTDAYIGDSSIVTVNEGVYYINGYFVGVSKQIVPVSKYSSTPSATVGLTFNESIVTAKDDETLYDNAQGFYNYTAPGADRYKIELTLTVKDANYSVTANASELSFIDLLQVINGQIQYQYNNTKYAEFERIFARRTYEESGDYVVKDFSFKVRNYRSNNRGEWVAKTPYLAGDVVTHASVYFEAKNSNMSGTTGPTVVASNPNEPVSDGNIIWTPVTATTARFNDGLNTAVGSTVEDHAGDDNKFVITTSPGKAYIKGFEVETTGKQTIVADKARTTKIVSNAQVAAVAGRYVRVTNVVGFPATSICQPIIFKDVLNNTIGSGFLKNIELESGLPTASTATWRVYFFGVKMNAGKDFQYNVTKIASGDATTFTCDLITNQYALGTTGTASSSGTTLNGINTFFAKWLKVGYVLKYGTVAYPITAITNEVTLTTSTGLAVPASTSINNIYVQYVDILGAADAIVPLSNPYVKSLRNASNVRDTSYVCVREWNTGAVSGTTHTLSIVLPENGETFLTTGHLTFCVTDGVYVNPTYAWGSGGTDSKKLVISGLTNGKTYKVLTAVKRAGNAAKEKIKTLTTKTIIVNAAGYTAGTNPTTATAGSIYDYTSGSVALIAGTSAYNSNSTTIPLTEADVQRIHKVVRIDATGNETDDITSWYSFDDGQRPTMYEVSTISKKNANNVNSATTRLKITFEYYAHSDGDYFSIDSYVGVPYENVPIITTNDITYVLGDCLDFRPRKSDSGADFSSTGTSVPNPLVSYNTLETSYSYYLPRADLITLNSDGSFEYVQGDPSENRISPSAVDANSITLATIGVTQFTYEPKRDVIVTYQQHRRYTMADIGKLDTRLGNVEQYVALSALEKATADMKIYDDNGLDRFKNGFLVDQFKDANVADTSSTELIASIDTDTLTMTTAVTSPRTDSRVSIDTMNQNLTQHGSYIMLGASTSTFLNQGLATRSEFINPFAVVTYYGNARMTPALDQWSDTVDNAVIFSADKKIENKSINAGWDFGAMSAASSAFNAEMAKAKSIPGVKINNVSHTLSTQRTTVVPGFWDKNPTTEAARAANNALLARSWTENRITGGFDSFSYEVSQDTVMSFTSSLASATKMRPKTSVLAVNALKPGMSISVKLDNQDISSIVSPCDVIYGSSEFNNVVGVLGDVYHEGDSYYSTGGTYPRHYYENGAAKTGERPYDKFNFGSVIRDSGGTTTAIVVAKERVKVNGIAYWALYVTNVLGNIANFNSTNIYNVESGAYVGLSNGGYTTGAAIATNSIGSFYGLIKFNNSYATGQKRITVSRYDGDLLSGNAIAEYTAFGNILTNNKTLKRETTVTNFQTSWAATPLDPLAQSFKVDQNSYPNGIILKSVKLFFAQVGTTSNVVLVDLVEVENGYPSQKVVVNSTSSYQPAANTVYTSTTSDYATEFPFMGPVHLLPGKEYAIRIRTNDVAIKMWIAQAGEPVVATSAAGGATVDAAALNSPSNTIGSLFKSQNASTWSAEQTQDLKFELIRYTFNTAVSGYFDGHLVKPTTQDTTYTSYSLTVDAVESIMDLPGDATKDLVKVRFPNHGYIVNQIVSYVSSLGTLKTTSVYKIINDDYIVIARTKTDTISKMMYGVKYDSFVLSTDDFLPSAGTTLSYTIKHFNTDGNYDSDYSIYRTGTLNELSVVKFVDPYNPAASGATARTALVRGYLASNSVDVSPIINVSSLHCHLFSNRVNVPSTADYLLNTTIAGTTITNKPMGKVRVLSGVSLVQFGTDTTGYFIETLSPSVDFSLFQVGARLAISGTTSNNTTDGSEAQILSIDYDNAKVYVDKVLATESSGVATYTIDQYSLFIDEFAPKGGTAEAKYVHIPVTLETQATGLKIMFAASIPYEAEVVVYYRTSVAGSSKVLSELPWTNANVTYNKTLYGAFVDQEFDVNGITSFDQFQVKLVMKSTNAAMVPKFKDLRIIALA